MEATLLGELYSLKKLFASKRIEADLDLIRLIFACFVFSAYFIYSLCSRIFTSIRFKTLTSKRMNTLFASVYAFRSDYSILSELTSYSFLFADFIWNYSL
jgi:hypothetical protein